MRELDFSSKPKLRVKTGEATFEVAFPTVDQAEKFYESVKDSDKDSKTESFNDFLVELGWQGKKASSLLTPDQLKDLAEGLMGDVKKK